VTLSAGDYSATFLPEVGMLGASLTWCGVELLSLHGGVQAFREGHTTGLPLLAPWANRLSRRQFRVGRVDVDIRGVDLHTDANGLPIHGTMVGPIVWEVVRSSATRLAARHRYDSPAFPFPHELEVDARLTEDGLRVATSVRPIGRRRVPVSFGWHPYLRLPGKRSAWVLGLPARRHLELDELGIPTGGSTREPAGEHPIGARTFDDLYALGRDRLLTLESDDLRIELRFGAGYPFAQVFAPRGKEFIALEPMTAPTDALVKGTARLVEPGQRFAAGFRISASGAAP